MGVVGGRVESLRACGLVSGARRLAAACARSMRFRQAKAGSRWAAPSEAGPSSGARALAAHSDPGTCPVTAVSAPHGPCALMVDDGCLAQGEFNTISNRQSAPFDFIKFGPSPLNADSWSDSCFDQIVIGCLL